MNSTIAVSVCAAVYMYNNFPNIYHAPTYTCTHVWFILCLYTQREYSQDRLAWEREEKLVVSAWYELVRPFLFCMITFFFFFKHFLFTRTHVHVQYIVATVVKPSVGIISTCTCTYTCTCMSYKTLDVYRTLIMMKKGNVLFFQLQFTV